MFSLYKLSVTKEIKAYAWINPDGVCFTSREIAPIGFVKAADGFANGMTVKDLRANGFKKASTKMSQEHLSKGCLL
jgi:hypothetical protein